MIDIEFEVGGKKIRDPSKLGDAIEQAVFSQVAGSIRDSLAGVTCAEHGERPQVTVSGRDLDSLEVEVEGCCNALIDRATSKLS